MINRRRRSAPDPTLDEPSLIGPIRRIRRIGPMAKPGSRSMGVPHPVWWRKSPQRIPQECGPHPPVPYGPKTVHAHVYGWSAVRLEKRTRRCVRKRCRTALQWYTTPGDGWIGNTHWTDSAAGSLGEYVLTIHGRMNHDPGTMFSHSGRHTLSMGATHGMVRAKAAAGWLISLVWAALGVAGPTGTAQVVARREAGQLGRRPPRAVPGEVAGQGAPP